MKYLNMDSLFTYRVVWKRRGLVHELRTWCNPRPRQCLVGSLAGAAHLLNDNAGVLRFAHREQKSRVE